MIDGAPSTGILDSLVCTSINKQLDLVYIAVCACHQERRHAQGVPNGNVRVLRKNDLDCLGLTGTERAHERRLAGQAIDGLHVCALGNEYRHRLWLANAGCPHERRHAVDILNVGIGI